MDKNLLHFLSTKPKCCLSHIGKFNIEYEYSPPPYMNDIFYVESYNVYLNKRKDEYEIEIDIQSTNRDCAVGYIELNEIHFLLNPLENLNSFDLLEMNFPSIEVINLIDDREELIKKYGFDGFIDKLPYGLVNFLLNKGYDVFNYIETGFAKDINKYGTSDFFTEEDYNIYRK